MKLDLVKRVTEALGDLRRTWPQLVLADLLARTVAVVVLLPLTGMMLKVFLLKADDGVLTDADIAVFLLHPIGLAALVIVGAVALAILFAEQGALMVIGFGAVADRRVSWLDALQHVARCWRRLIDLGGRVLGRLLLIAAPFLAGIAGIYLLFLREHDINFYLTYKPPEFRRALALAALLLVVLALIVLKRLSGWFLAIPLVLFESNGGRDALRHSAEATAPFGWRLALGTVGWIGGVFLLSTAVSFVIGQAGELLIPSIDTSTALLAAGLGSTLLLAGVGNLAIQVVSTVLFPLILVRLYRALAGPDAFDDLASRETLGSRASRVPGKLILVGTLGALVLIVGGAYLAARSMEGDETVAIIAHRGASADAPENTMAAFERAVADGADWIELDVQENADGTVVVAHDSDFMKVARNGAKVWDVGDEELKDIDIGSWFAPDFSDQRAPTLGQVLEMPRGETGVVIELKYYGHDERLESRVAEVVEAAGAQDEIMLMSLKREGLKKVAELRPDWTRGLLNTVAVGDLTKLDLDFLALNARAASRAMIRRAHKRGMKVFVWTVNDPMQMSVMISRGADGVITDEPAVGRTVLEVREHLTPFGRLLLWIAGETGFLRDDEAPSTAEDA